MWLGQHGGECAQPTPSNAPSSHAAAATVNLARPCHHAALSPLRGTLGWPRGVPLRAPRGGPARREAQGPPAAAHPPSLTPRRCAPTHWQTKLPLSLISSLRSLSVPLSLLRARPHAAQTRTGSHERMRAYNNKRAAHALARSRTPTRSAQSLRTAALQTSRSERKPALRKAFRFPKSRTPKIRSKLIKGVLREVNLKSIRKEMAPRSPRAPRPPSASPLAGGPAAPHRGGEGLHLGPRRLHLCSVVAPRRVIRRKHPNPAGRPVSAGWRPPAHPLPSPFLSVTRFFAPFDQHQPSRPAPAPGATRQP